MKMHVMPIVLATGIAAALFFTGCGSSSHSGEAQYVWAVGDADTEGYAAVLRSKDGGAHWERVDANGSVLEGFDLQNLHVVDNEEVWAVGTGQTLVHTDDGGGSWSRYATFPEANASIGLYGISALSENEFWVSGEHGSVYHTQDGASHWTRMNPADFHNGLVQGIMAVDRLTVYAVGQPADGSGGFVSRTLDGGQSWQSVVLPGGYNDTHEWIGVKATDADHIVVYGCKGYYSATENGGQTWQNGRIVQGGGGDGADINDLVMLDAVHWWTAMDYEGIFYTEDAGAHWTEQNSTGGGSFLVGIDALDASHAVIAGMFAGYPPAGKLLLTRDGGTTWKTTHETVYALNKVAFARKPKPVNAEEGGSMFASIIRTSVEGLVGGATGEIGGFVMGLILDKIGWGSQGDDQEDDLLKSMNAKLDEIVAGIKSIESALDDLKLKLDIDEEALDKDILDPSDAITKIDTVHEEFVERFGTLKAGEGNQTEIRNFIDDNINGEGFYMRTQVNTIHDAVISPDGVKTPALTNYATYVNNKYAAGYGTLTEAYDALEKYASHLIIKQLKGVNLIAEGKHVEEGNASVAAFMQDYRQQLHEMLADADNGASFIYNAYRMALEHANPLPYKTGDDYFTDEVNATLKRAEFFRLQATGSDSFGPRILVFETQDTQSDKTYYIANPSAFTGFSAFECNQTTAQMPGHVYTYWEGNHIKPSTLYNVYECAISDPIEAGTYDIYDADPYRPKSDENGTQTTTPKVIAKMELQRYDGNYTQCDDGNFTYGHRVFFHRSAWNHFGHDSTYWKTQTDDMYLSQTYGDAPWGIGLLGTADGEYEYTGHYELDGTFHYDGAEKRTLYVDYSAAYHMVTNSYYTGAGSSEAHAYVHFGVWDHTDGKAVDHCGPFYNHHQDTVAEEKDTHHRPKGVCGFTAQPGHSYYVYFSMHEHGISGMEGDGTHSRIYLEGIDYIYLHF